jgi:hypothetical protein
VNNYTTTSGKFIIIFFIIIFITTITFPPLKSVMCQDLALQQGAQQLQTASADLWTFSVNITSP